MVSRILGYIIVTLRFEREGDKWVGTCLELGTGTYARTLRQVQGELHQLITAHINALEQEGERERFFSEHNIKFYTVVPKQQTVVWPIADKDWDELIKPAPSLGPFFQPHLFEVIPTKQSELINAGV